MGVVSPSTEVVLSGCLGSSPVECMGSATFKAEITLYQNFFEAIEKKFLTVWVPGTDGQDMVARVRARTHGTTDT